MAVTAMSGLPGHDDRPAARGDGTTAGAGAHEAIWVERLTLTNFRNYRRASLNLDKRPVVLTGLNGAGKTNLLEAVSLLAPGRGLRRVPFNDLARGASAGAGDWAVAAHLHGSSGSIDIGTGLTGPAASNRAGRLLRIDGETQGGSGALGDHVEMIWLTPAMDGLFTGPASERRRFLDRLIICFDAGYGRRAGRFERAMRQRNRLLEEGVSDNARLEGLETQMAETGVAIAAARAEAVVQLRATIETRRAGARRAEAPLSPFPWAGIELDGGLESDILTRPAADVEDGYLRLLRAQRERDRAAGRALVGPHRTDLVVAHGPKSMPARLCSTGEQKALLIGLVLAHAVLIKQRRAAAPILLLDEIAAHLDAERRTALFDEILALGAQAWMSGTDRSAFAALSENAQFLNVADGSINSDR